MRPPDRRLAGLERLDRIPPFKPDGRARWIRGQELRGRVRPAPALRLGLNDPLRLLPGPAEDRYIRLERGALRLRQCAQEVRLAPEAARRLPDALQPVGGVLFRLLRDGLEWPFSGQ